jgi:hypothetical protein
MLWHQEIVIMLRQLYIKLRRLFVSEVVINAIGRDGNNAARPHNHTCKHTANASTVFSILVHFWWWENTKTELVLILKHLPRQNPISMGSKHNNHTFHWHNEVHQRIIHFKARTPFVKWAVRGSSPSWKFRVLHSLVFALADIANIWQKYVFPSLLSRVPLQYKLHAPILPH